MKATRSPQKRVPASQRVATAAWVITGLLALQLIPVLLPTLPHPGVPFCATDPTASRMVRVVTLAKLLDQAGRYDEERLYLLEETLKKPRDNGVSIKGDHRVIYDESSWSAFMLMALDRGDRQWAAKEVYDYYLGETSLYLRTRCQGPAFSYQKVNLAAFRLPTHLLWREYREGFDPTKPLNEQ